MPNTEFRAFADREALSSMGVSRLQYVSMCDRITSGANRSSIRRRMR